MKNKYLKQEKHHNKILGRKYPWDNADSVDSWRHKRMHQLINPFLEKKGKKWLTVGDGGFGREAHYIEKMGGDAVASDIAAKPLIIAKKRRYIKKYKKVNAEKMPFKNGSFNYVLCKESYHHFPRPIISLYEMIRVSRDASILIEPNDVMKRKISLKNFLSIENINNYIDRFEISGNYVYQISRREMIKVAYGLELPLIAFKGIDDHYIEGVESEIFDKKGKKYKKIKFVLKILNILYKLRLRDRSILAIIFFKRTPNKDVLNKLMKDNYNLHFLKNNPYSYK
ncbi:MAG: methyltransferase domain-containing protein [Candidatus Pacebacteria bacterium]|jgi:SAM-dependent methyltransferase|nr:methyltransferase domain-containing protein [Candidatus Paceibacterota bacterium]MBT6756064.1 methyltransferase domain-containing protein [Candidatus Paceibacterota bacterium]